MSEFLLTTSSRDTCYGASGIGCLVLVCACYLCMLFCTLRLASDAAGRYIRIQLICSCQVVIVDIACVLHCAQCACCRNLRLLHAAGAAYLPARHSRAHFRGPISWSDGTACTVCNEIPLLFSLPVICVLELCCLIHCNLVRLQPL